MGFTDDTNRPMRELSDQKAKVYLDGPKRAYVMVAGDHQYFPKRGLETLRYSIEDTYSGLYSRIRGYLGARSSQRLHTQAGVRTYLCALRLMALRNSE